MFSFSPLPLEMMQFDSYETPNWSFLVIFGDTGIAKQNMPLIEKNMPDERRVTFFSPAFSSEVSEM